MKTLSEDARWMDLALREARKGLGRTSPNPPVGAVLVRGGRLLSKSYHRKAGAAHAEIQALGNRRYSEATLYVTLEPCSTPGRTGRCTDKILHSGIGRVVVGTSDPNPAHRGRGLRLLQRQGVRVRVGVRQKEARELIEGFEKAMRKSLPAVKAKMAMSLDGKVATRTGDSRWISSKESRALVQRMRREADAVCVGAGTVRLDNPRLTLRGNGAKEKPFVRLVVDSKLSISPRARVLRALPGHETWIATSAAAIEVRGRRYARKGVRLIAVRQDARGVSLKSLFEKVCAMGIHRVLLEGGPTMLNSALRDGLVDDMAIFVAPKLLGGPRGLIAGEGVRRVRDAIACNDLRMRRVGSDLLLECKITGGRGV